MYNWVNATAEKEHSVMLTPKIGAENTYALAIHKDFAEKNNIKSISDLIPYAPKLVFGTEHEFFDIEGTMRYIPLCEHYGLTFKDSKSIDVALKYAAMDSGNMDVTMVYSTDGMNKKSDLFILKDFYGGYWDGLTYSELDRYESAFFAGEKNASVLIDRNYTKSMPATYILGCELDPLADDSRVLFEILKAKGHTVELAMKKGYTHAFLHYSRQNLFISLNKRKASMCNIQGWDTL